MNEEPEDIIMDMLFQNCGKDDIIDNHCLSCYEAASDYLEKKGYLKKINCRIYKIIKM